mmetsp:Transcript_34365/g.71972  ORF Transcript_34365/g.71972 Transcript_34365/m.71972 type:complete len:120 (-) Transcript_34365:145-504(-)
MALAMKTVAMKGSMKSKLVSKIAKGKLARAMVLRGSKEKTATGLRKDNLFRNKYGKIVSKKASAASKKRYQTNPAKVWADCVKAARKSLNVTGFVAINGKRAEGKALYAKSKSLYAERA